MKILKINNKYINMDHILCYDVEQTDRGTERIITFTAYLNNDIQIREAFFSKTSKISASDVKQKILELLCYYDAINYVNFYNVCKSLEKKCE